MRQKHTRHDHAACDFACERLEDRVLLSTVRFANHDLPDFVDTPVIADLDGDGDLDLVGLTQPAGNFRMLTMLINDGEGSFTQNDVQGVGLASVLGSLDVNEDGKQDALVSTDTALGIMFGNGDGTFQSPQFIAGTTGSSRVFLGETNGDGITDAIAVDGSMLSYLQGDGSTLNLAFSFSLPTGFEALAAHDQNSDGLIDVIAGSSSAVQVWTTISGGVTPGPLTTPGVSSDVKIGDVNSDGIADLLSFFPGRNGRVVRLGNDQGRFVRDDDLTSALSLLVSQHTPQRQVLLADIDLDGNLDLFIAGGATPGVKLGDGTGRFVHRHAWILSSPFDLTDAGVGDLNDDGIADVVINDLAFITRGWAPASRTIEIDDPDALIPGRPVSIRVTGVEAGLGRTVARVVVSQRLFSGASIPASSRLLELTPDPNDPSIWAFTGVLPDDLFIGTTTIQATVIDDLGDDSLGFSTPTRSAHFQSRIFFPDAFYSPRHVTERLFLSSPQGAISTFLVPVPYQVLVHYPGGRTDIVAQGEITDNAIQSIFLSRKGRPGKSLVEPRLAYSVEVISERTLIGTLRRTENFGPTPQTAATTASSLVDTSATTQGFADVSTSGLDFIAWFNPYAEDTSVTASFYEDGQLVTSVDRPLGALRRGGLNLHNIQGLVEDHTYSVVLTSSNPILASLSRWSRDGQGATQMGDTSRGQSIVRVDYADDVQSSLVLFNPTDQPLAVDTTTTFDDLFTASVTSSIVLSPFERRVFDPAPGTTTTSGATVRLDADQPLYAMSHTVSVSRGDSIASASASIVSGGWLFTGGTFRRGSSLDRLVLVNSGVQTELFLFGVILGSTVTSRTIEIAAGETLSIDLELEPAFFDSTDAVSPYSIVLDHIHQFTQPNKPVRLTAMLENWDPATGKAWSLAGTPKLVAFPF